MPPAPRSLRRRALPGLLGATIVLALGGGLAHQLEKNTAPALIAPAHAAEAIGFTPPDESSIPAGPDGEAIRRGKAIFENPRGTVPAYVGNDMACRNCHLDAGRKPFAAPMWAAWTAYPKYRSKNRKIVTMEERIRDCFLYSMNAPASPSGGPPPLGDPLYADMTAYFHWLATGAPTGLTLAGAGFRPLPKPTAGYDRERGRAIYAEHCAACHGDTGEGQKDSDGTVLFPPLWGAQSYNWGAGMARLDRAASFIKENMPMGAEGSLTEQQAWDVAAWIDSHERPKDPRQTGTVSETALEHHADEPSFYGKSVDGRQIGSGTLPTKP